MIKNYGCLAAIIDMIIFSYNLLQQIEVGVLNTSVTKRLLLSNLIAISLLRYPTELLLFSNNNDVNLIMML